MNCKARIYRAVGPRRPLRFHNENHLGYGMEVEIPDNMVESYILIEDVDGVDEAMEIAMSANPDFDFIAVEDVEDRGRRALRLSREMPVSQVEEDGVPI